MENRLSVSDAGKNNVLPGWKHVEIGQTPILEAPLKFMEEYGEADPSTSSVILISAPGAVGKSTFARELSYQTSAMLLDLAAAEPVGANTITGGLARTGLFQPFEDGKASLIVDGLDEARMKVPQANFSAFMKDVAELAEDNRSPLVLLGRTGAVQEAWLWLNEYGLQASILQIDYFDDEQAAIFAKAHAKHIRGETEQREPDGRAIDLILNQLKKSVPDDGRNFVGYSPVLIAVAKHVADPEDRDSSNTQALIARLQNGEEQITLPGISRSILRREQCKIRQLSLEEECLQGKLYSPEEQISRLVTRIYGTPFSFPMPSMSTQDQEMYDAALESWVSYHPFFRW